MIKSQHAAMMAEMFFSGYTNNSEAKSRNSLNPLLSRRERASTESLRNCKNLSTTGSALQNWSSTVLATFQERKKKKAFFLHSSIQILLDELTNKKA